MKVYVVCIDYNYEGYSEPEFASLEREKAEKYINDKYSKFAKFQNVSLEEYIEKHVKTGGYEIVELELDE